MRKGLYASGAFGSTRQCEAYRRKGSSLFELRQGILQKVSPPLRIASNDVLRRPCAGTFYDDTSKVISRTNSWRRSVPKPQFRIYGRQTDCVYVAGWNQTAKAWSYCESRSETQKGKGRQGSSRRRAAQSNRQKDLKSLRSLLQVQVSPSFTFVDWNADSDVCQLQTTMRR